MSRAQPRVSQLYGLSITFAILFAVSWVGHIVARWSGFQQTHAELGLSTNVSDFFLDVMSTTLQNWQSDFLQAFAMVTLGAWLLHKNSAQSKDTQDEIQASVQRIESRLDAMEAARSPRP